MIDNIKNINNKSFWMFFGVLLLVQQGGYTQIPAIHKVNKKYDVWQIDRTNYHWPKRKRDFRPQLFYLFFPQYKKRNHNNWRQHVPIEITSNQIVRPQVEAFRDTMSRLLKSRSIQYAFQKVSVGWHVHYKKQIHHKRSQIRKEMELLSDRGGSTRYLMNELVTINQYVDGIKNALMNDIEKQKGFSQALYQYHQLLNAIHARKQLVELQIQNKSFIHKDPIQTYIQSAKTFSQQMKKITW